MDFQVTGLRLAPFAPLFCLSDAELAKLNIVRQVVEASPGTPCRVSLQDAEPGEKVLLLNYEHLPVTSPYRATHAIFVRENAIEAKPSVNEIPEVLARRLLSLRAYDSKGMMLTADVVQGREMQPVIAAMFADPNVEYIHAHNAKPGCFAARIDRA
jgi:uncharacterized protein DUF1203